MAELVINIPDETIEVAKEIMSFVLEVDSAYRELADRLSKRVHEVNQYKREIAFYYDKE